MRSTIVTIIMIGYSFVTFIAAPMTNWIAPHYGWQGVYVAGGMGTLVCAAALWLKLPESVRFLVTKGLKPDLVAATLRRMDPASSYTSRDRFVLSDEPKVDRQFRVSDLFRGRLRAITPLLWLGYIASSLAIYFAASWGPIVGAAVLSSGLPVLRSYALLAVCPAVLFACALGIHVVTRPPAVASVHAPVLPS